jgi:AcrR family transcriptional regulator
MGRNKNFEKNVVLDKAIQVFWKKGLADSSLQDLEKATGVNKSGLYSEFQNKEDLFCESLKRYQDTHPALQVLDRSPMGWNNIEDFLKIGTRCSGQKGCYFANTLREASIIPSRATDILFGYVSEIRESLLANLKHTNSKHNIEVLADLILTVSTGNSLKMNVVHPDLIEKEIDSYIELLKDTE